MIILLSPAKTLDFESQSATEVCTQPDFLKFSKFLVNGLNKLSAAEIGELMSISPKLAELNRQRFQEWAARHDEKSSKQAVLAFKGGVYEGLKAWDFGPQEFEFAQKHLRILSGLYGLFARSTSSSPIVWKWARLMQTRRARIFMRSGEIASATD